MEREEHGANKGNIMLEPFKPKSFPCFSGPYSFFSYTNTNTNADLYLYLYKYCICIYTNTDTRYRKNMVVTFIHPSPHIMKI